MSASKDEVTLVSDEGVSATIRWGAPPAARLDVEETEHALGGPARTWPSKKEKLKAEVSDLKTVNQKLEALIQKLERENAELKKGNNANELAIKQALGELVTSDARLKELEEAAQTLAKKADDALLAKFDAETKLRSRDEFWKDQLAEAQEQARINLAVERRHFSNLEAYVRRVEANLRAEHQAMLKWRETAKRTADALGQMSRNM